MKKLIFQTFFFVVVLLGLNACGGNTKPKPDPSIPPTYAIKVEPKFVKQAELSFTQNDEVLTSIDIELADTPKERELGLMHRRSMAQNQGMLFIFDKEERQSFWMKDTHIALDIIFVNEAKEIVHIAPDCPPYSLRSIPSFEYAKYVVEVNSGYCKINNIKVGDGIKF